MAEGEIEFDKSGPRNGKRFYIANTFTSRYGTDL
jgi:hypothetical protein